MTTTIQARFWYPKRRQQDEQSKCSREQQRKRKSITKQSNPPSTQAPILSSLFDAKSNKSVDIDFEERFEAVRSVSPTEETEVVSNKLSEEEKSTLQGAGVTLAELGEHTQAASLRQDLAKEKPSDPDPDVLRLLGVVKYKLKDYEGSAAAYKLSAMASKDINFELLRGLTNALLAAKKPDEAVKVLLDS
ncbi:hypothetical protein LWI28_017598 [Acer negundo]|uniref:Uncharacterized protein n=1 Tax=Acer negundo TaxID=4023 RepID=A0AAD5IFT7_ACENE|nr:hypothetical protein LWI28_017598 [Acer negundo]